MNEVRGIFINYRREDSAGSAGRLHDRLEANFGSDKVFMDVEGIQSGEDFAEAIDAKLASCDVFIAVIGRGWLKAADQYGRRRLDTPTDWTRLELAAALSRGLLIIPLLVEDAELPPADALPGDLVRLVDLQAMEIHHATFHEDVKRLLDRIQQHTKLRQGAGMTPSNLPAGTVRVHPKDKSEYAWVPREPSGSDAYLRTMSPMSATTARNPSIPWRSAAASGSAGHRPPSQRSVATSLREDCKCHARPKTIQTGRIPISHRQWSWGRAHDCSALIGGRLPTEAQWEYAARGGVDGRIYPWGDTITPKDANYFDNKDWGSPSPVGCFPPTGFNLYDMIGNVWEWVADWFDPDIYSKRSQIKPTIDPQVYKNETDKRIVRGGSWRSIPAEVRTSIRGFQTPLDGFTDFGSRCLVDDIQ